MRVSRSNTWTAAALAVALAFGAGLTAAAEREPLAAVATHGDHVSWATLSSAPEIALHVTGPADSNFSERFANGSAPVFGLFDREGNARPDGVYSWELREEWSGINDNVRDEANGRNGARHTESRRVETASRMQSGTFTIENGAIVDSSIVEVKAARPSTD